MFSEDYFTASLKVKLAVDKRNMVAHLLNSLHMEDIRFYKRAQQQSFNSSFRKFFWISSFFFTNAKKRRRRREKENELEGKFKQYVVS